jgi:hypothetical protein
MLFGSWYQYRACSFVQDQDVVGQRVRRGVQTPRQLAQATDSLDKVRCGSVVAGSVSSDRTPRKEPDGVGRVANCETGVIDAEEGVGAVSVAPFLGTPGSDAPVAIGVVANRLRL